MSMPLRRQDVDDVYYPDSDGRPMGETPRHIQVMLDTFTTLADHFAGDADVFLAANMFLYYVRGQPRKHVSPDVFLVRGVPKDRDPERRSYRLWEEKKGPDFVLEVTSESTQKEDLKEKFRIYQDELKVREFFLFDPYEEYLDPPLRGYTLQKGKYAEVRAVKGRLPSKVLGLYLEQDGADLRLYDPRRRRWLPTRQERAEHATERAKRAVSRARQQGARAAQEAARAAQEAAGRQQAEAEVARLLRELDELRQRLP